MSSSYSHLYLVPKVQFDNFLKHKVSNFSNVKNLKVQQLNFNTGKKIIPTHNQSQNGNAFSDQTPPQLNINHDINSHSEHRPPAPEPLDEHRDYARVLPPEMMDYQNGYQQGYEDDRLNSLHPTVAANDYQQRHVSNKLDILSNNATNYNLMNDLRASNMSDVTMQSVHGDRPRARSEYVPSLKRQNDGSSLGIGPPPAKLFVSSASAPPSDSKFKGMIKREMVKETPAPKRSTNAPSVSQAIAATKENISNFRQSARFASDSSEEEVFEDSSSATPHNQPPRNPRNPTILPSSPVASKTRSKVAK